MSRRGRWIGGLACAALLWLAPDGTATTTPSATVSPTATWTLTPTPTGTPTRTCTPTPTTSPTLAPLASLTATQTHSPTPYPSVTVTLTRTATSTVTPVPGLHLNHNWFNPETGQTVVLSGVTAAHGEVEVKVYTQAGFLVRELTGSASERPEWNGRNAQGQVVASGVYVLAVYGDRLYKRFRVVVIK